MIYPAGWLLIALFTVSETPKDDHIRWRFSSLKQSKSEWNLVFTAEIDRGWHLYSQSIESGGPMPTTFEFQDGDGFKLVGKVKEAGERKEVYDSTFMLNVVWYERQVVFTQRVRARSPIGIEGVVNYSVCTNEICVPGSVKFKFDLRE